MLYAFDTNVYISAQRDLRARATYDRLVTTLGRRLRLPAVVALELRAGVRNIDQREALDALVNAFASRDGVVVPSATAFLEAGRVISDLATRERFTYGTDTPALVHDALIAASCREATATLITDNHEDFTRIQRHLRGFRFVAPAALG